MSGPGKKLYVVQKLINAYLDQNLHDCKKVPGTDYSLRMTPQKIRTGFMDSTNDKKTAPTPPMDEVACTTWSNSEAAAKFPTPSDINKGPTPFTPSQKRGRKLKASTEKKHPVLLLLRIMHPSRRLHRRRINALPKNERIERTLPTN